MDACREAARLMSARRDEPQRPWQALALKLHLRLCGDCREVERQLEQIDRLSSALFRGAPDADSRAEDEPTQR